MDDKFLNISSQVLSLKETLSSSDLQLKTFRKSRTGRERGTPNVIKRASARRDTNYDADIIFVGIPKLPVQVNNEEAIIHALVEGSSDERFYRQLESKARVSADSLQRTRAYSFGTPASLISSESAVLMRLAKETSENYSPDPAQGREIELGREQRQDDEESNSDPNYKAYLADVEQLTAEHGECVVAYARGKRIALGNTLAELKANIPEEYRNEDILIQRLPDKTITLRGTIRVYK